MVRQRKNLKLDRNKIDKKDEKKTEKEVKVSNAFSWNALEHAKFKLQELPKGIATQPAVFVPQKEIELVRAKAQHAHYEALVQNKKSTAYSSVVKPSPVKETLDAIGPFLTILVSMLCVFILCEYFLRNIFHEMIMRFAVGLVFGSILACVELYFILKKFT